MCSLEKKESAKSLSGLHLQQTDLDSNKTAIVIVDMQSPFTSQLLDNVLTSLVEAQIQILRTCARKDIPVVVLEYWNRKDTINEISKELKLIPRVRFILKRKWDGFHTTILNEVLNGFKAKTFCSWVCMRAGVF